jgi:hypothetical protein
VFLAVRGVGDHDCYQLGISLRLEEKQKGKGIPCPYLQKECWKIILIAPFCKPPIKHETQKLK